jgi:transcriptional regulator with XRE-family HTH domain
MKTVPTVTPRRQRGGAPGQTAERIDLRRLRHLLEAYSRGAGLSLGEVAARLGVTRARISQILGGRTRFPLSRRLVRRCRERGQHMRGQAGRGLRLLSDKEVREARRRRAGGETLQAIADDLGVSAGVISRVVRRLSYGDVEDRREPKVADDAAAVPLLHHQP